MTKNPLAQNLLSKAIRDHNLDSVKLAIVQGAEIQGPIQGEDVRADFQNHIEIKTVADMAVLKARELNETSILVYLQQNGINLDLAIKNAMGNSANSVISYCPTEVFSFIHMHYPTLYGDWNTTFTPHKLAEYRNDTNLKQLIAWGVDVNTKDDLGRTPLMISSSAECSNVLIEAGVDVQEIDNQGNTAIWHITTKICDDYNFDQDGIDEDYAKNLAMLSKYYGIQHDPKAGEISQNLINTFNEVDTYELENHPCFISTWPLLNQAMQQAREVMSKQHMIELGKFAEPKEDVFEKKNSGPRF